jgi:hypothetical protein
MNGTVKYNALLHQVLYEEKVSDVIELFGLEIDVIVPIELYRKMVDYLRFQLVEKWCLCKSCQLFDIDNSKYDQWIEEFKMCIDFLKSHEISDKVNKHRLLRQMLIRDYDYEDSYMIQCIINSKFNYEQITNQHRDMVAVAFTKKIKDIINLISNNSIMTSEYVMEEFDKAINE